MKSFRCGRVTSSASSRPFNLKHESLTAGPRVWKDGAERVNTLWAKQLFRLYLSASGGRASWCMILCWSDYNADTLSNQQSGVLCTYHSGKTDIKKVPTGQEIESLIDWALTRARQWTGDNFGGRPIDRSSNGDDDLFRRQTRRASKMDTKLLLEKGWREKWAKASRNTKVMGELRGKLLFYNLKWEIYCEQIRLT